MASDPPEFNVTYNMLIMREETVGPIAAVQVVNSFDEALSKAASSAYGLAAMAR